MSRWDKGGENAVDRISRPAYRCAMNQTGLKLLPRLPAIGKRGHFKNAMRDNPMRAKTLQPETEIGCKPTWPT